MVWQMEQRVFSIMCTLFGVKRIPLLLSVGVLMMCAKNPVSKAYYSQKLHLSEYGSSSSRCDASIVLWGGNKYSLRQAMQTV